MKKIKIFTILICIITILSGCSLFKEKPKDNIKNNQINIDDNANALVLYFSATNNTEKIAQYIANINNLDIVKIMPEEEYTEADLNYDDENCRANKEQNNDQSRPQIQNKLELDNYDVIYLGYPIWWGKEPKIILTLLDNYNLEGKTIIPFCTSGGSGIETSVYNLRKYNNKLNILDGKTFSANSSREDVEKWLENYK